MVILNRKKYKAGYEVRDELSQTDFEAVPITVGDPEVNELVRYMNEHRGEHVIVKAAYTPLGDYIGDPKAARYLICKRGIKPQKIDPSCNICSIGFCEREQKWYGWSHRAIFGFGIGSMAKEGDCCTTSGWTEEYLNEHPEERLRVIPVGFKAETLQDAKRMAIAFAESVS